MAFIMLTTGLVYEVPADRATVNSALANQPKADTTVNGVPVSIRTAQVAMVADSIEGLRPTYVVPIEVPVPDAAA